MAEKSNRALTTVAVSSLIVAACAVTVTVKVMTSDTVPVEPPRVLDPAAVERQATAYIQGLTDNPVKG